MQQPWGNEQTKHFYALEPGRILDAVEQQTNLRCTGRAMALNSMENRVYELEIETDTEPQTPADRYRIAKFYRPGRWTLSQIAEEHQFLLDLKQAEIPAVAPLQLANGSTVATLADEEIHFAVFPKVGGRSPDELSPQDLQIVGRLLARLHRVGASKKATDRIDLSTDSYGRANLKFLLDSNLIPKHLENNFKETCVALFSAAEPLWEKSTAQRIHGDAHLGNLLHGRQGFFWVDFDDMVTGPPVQDIWLMIPGRDDYAKNQLRHLLEGYEQMNHFNRSSLALIEVLRALRLIHFAAWIGRRWSDPSFPAAFPDYGSSGYWDELLRDLTRQHELIRETSQGRSFWNL